jgi:hypothetical protein
VGVFSENTNSLNCHTRGVKKAAADSSSLFQELLDDGATAIGLARSRAGASTTTDVVEGLGTRADGPLDRALFDFVADTNNLERVDYRLAQDIVIVVGHDGPRLISLPRNLCGQNLNRGPLPQSLDPGTNLPEPRIDDHSQLGKDQQRRHERDIRQ